MQKVKQDFELANKEISPRNVYMIQNSALLFRRANALAEQDLCLSSPNGLPWSQAFLTEKVETADKNRDDFHCMQNESCDEHVIYFRRQLK